MMQNFQKVTMIIVDFIQSNCYVMKERIFL